MRNTRARDTNWVVTLKKEKGKENCIAWLLFVVLALHWHTIPILAKGQGLLRSPDFSACDYFSFE